MAERESKHLSKSILLEESGNPAIVRMIILFSVVMLGALVMGLMVLIASRADQLWQFYAIFFIGSFIGGGSLFAPLFPGPKQSDPVAHVPSLVVERRRAAGPSPECH